MNMRIAVSLLMFAAALWFRPAGADPSRAAPERAVRATPSESALLDRVLYRLRSETAPRASTLARACGNGYSHVCRNDRLTCFHAECGSIGSDCYCPQFIGWWSAY